MKYKLTLLLLLIFVPFVLFSCTGIHMDILSYQPPAADVAGILKTDTGEFYIKISIDPYDGDGLRFGVIEYASPESIRGLSYSVSENVTVTVGSLTVPCGDTAAKKARDIMSLFAVNGEKAPSVTTKDGVRTAEFDGVTLKFKNGEDVPFEISGNGMTLYIDGYLFAGTDGQK